MGFELDRDDQHPLWNVRNLLTVLATLASLTFGMFIWDAERAIDKLDKVDTNSSTTAGQVKVLVDQVSHISNRQDQIAGRLDDHEKRLTVVETATFGPRRERP